MPFREFFVALFAHALEQAGGYSTQEAGQVAGTLLPDFLSFDLRTRRASRSMAGPSPRMPRTSSLAILANGKVTEDKVGPHGDLLAEFAYLGPPRNA